MWLSINLSQYCMFVVGCYFCTVLEGCGGGGGGGFFLACEDFGRMFDHSFLVCAYFFSKVEISSRTLIPLFRPGFEATVTECSLTSCV